MPPSPATQGQVYTPPAPTPRELIGCCREIGDLRGADLLTFASLTAPVVRELFAMADALKAEFRRVRGEDKETGAKETRRGEQGKRAKTPPPPRGRGTPSAGAEGDRGGAERDHEGAGGDRRRNPPPTPSRWEGARGARALAGASGSYASVLAGRTAVLLFEKPSLRTKMSFETGIGLLGGRSIFMDHSGQKLGEREAVKDYAKNLERWVDCIIARVFSQEILYELAEHARVPVINALSDRFHPCQALADLFTVAEVAAGMGKGARSGGEGVPLQDIKIAYVGDGNNVCHSLMHAATMLGVGMTVVTPKGYAPAEDVVEECEALARASGAKLDVTTKLSAVAGHHAVYTDVWVSMGQADQAAKRRKVFAPYQVNADVMATASRGLKLPHGAHFMHCLPAQRGVEVTDEVIDAPSSLVYEQAENRMHAQDALLAAMFAPRG